MNASSSGNARSVALALVTFTPGGIKELFPQLAATAPDEFPALIARYDCYILE